MLTFDDADLDEVDLLLIGLTEYLDEIGVSRSQQVAVARERQQVAMSIIDQATDLSDINFGIHTVIH